MSNFTQKIAAAAIAVTTLAGSMAATTTSVITTTEVASAITATPANAANCKVITAKGIANAVFNRAGERRAKRKANRDIRRQIRSEFDGKGKKIGRADVSCESAKGQKGQVSFQTCTIRQKACG